MAISIDWGARIINIPRADLTLLQSSPTEIRQLDLNEFRLTLRGLEDDPAGMAYPKTHRHNTAVTVGGVTLARVIEIVNGYTVTFEDGQYAVNLVGANSNVGDVVNVNQVSVRSANSAGLQDLSTLLASAYNGEVCVDVLTGQSGTSTPIGTRSTPVNNFADAKVIAESKSIRTIRILRSCTIGTVDFSGGYVFEGDNEVAVEVVLEPSAGVSQCAFRNLTITGTFDGENSFQYCSIGNSNYINGFIFQCALNGTITLGGNAQCSILDCWSNVASADSSLYPIIDMGGSGNSLAVRNYSGGLAISNYSGGGAVSVDMSSGRVVFRDTVTAGTMTIRGIADVEDLSTGTAVIVDATVNKTLDANLTIINEGVKKASILIPHTTDLA